MDQHLFKEILPREYIQRFLQNQIREDGRQFQQNRKTIITTNLLNDSSGSCMVKLGETISLCQLQFEQHEQLPNSYTIDDLIKIQFKYAQNQEAGMDQYDKQKQEAYYSELTQRFMRDNFPQIYQKLQINVPNYKQKFVAIQLYIQILSNDGNVFDATFLSLINCFNTTTMKVSLQADKGLNPFEQSLDQTIQFQELQYYMPITYSLLLQNFIVQDPSFFEEKQADLHISLVFNLETQNFIVYKIGGTDISYMKFRELIQFTKNNIKQIKSEVMAKRQVLKQSNHVEF